MNSPTHGCSAKSNTAVESSTVPSFSQFISVHINIVLAVVHTRKKGPRYPPKYACRSLECSRALFCDASMPYGFRHAMLHCRRKYVLPASKHPAVDRHQPHTPSTQHTHWHIQLTTARSSFTLGLRPQETANIHANGSVTHQRYNPPQR